MKKQFFTFLTAFMLVAISASARVRICGTDIEDGKTYTSFSGGTISSLATGGGNVKRSGSTITITNANITCTSGISAILVEESGLTIKFVGTCQVSATQSNCAGIWFEKSGGQLTIVGAGLDTKVSLYGKDCGIHIHNNTNVIVKDISLTCTGGANGIDGNDGKSSERLTLQGSNVYLKCQGGGSGGSLQDLSSLDYPSGYGIYMPQGGSFSTSSHCVVDVDSKKATGEVIIDKETNYGLQLCGVNVSNCNASVIGKVLKAKGMLSTAATTVSYSNKTLTLNNATLETSTPWVIHNESVDGLTITVSGTNKLTSSTPVALNSSTTIQGTGTLNANGVINFEKSNTLTIKNATVNCTSRITAYNQGTLNLVKCTVTTPELYQISAINFTDCDIANAGCFYDKTKKKVTDVKGNTPSSVSIKPVSSTYLSIMGRVVNDVNCASFACEGMTAGTISYDRSSSTLTLSGVTMTNPTSYENVGIFDYAASDVKTIKIVGDNKLTAKSHVFSLTGDVTFNGYNNGSQGTLTATSTNNDAYSVKSSSSSKSAFVTLNGGYLKFYGKQYGFNGVVANMSGYSATLRLSKNTYGTYEFKGEQGAAIGNVNTLERIGTDFLYSGTAGTPGCYYDAAKKAVCQNGGTIVKGGTNTVIVNYIKENYGVYIGGEQVNDCNCNAIGSRLITAGGANCLSYNKSTKTLTLKGVKMTLDAEANYGIYNASEAGLTIDASSLSNIHSPNDSKAAISVQKNTTLKGFYNLEGKLSASQSAAVTLKDCSMSVWDIDGNNNASLVVDLTTKGRRVDVTGYVHQLKSLRLDNGTKIVNPDGARYDTLRMCVINKDGTKAEGITFVDKTSTGISAIVTAPQAEVSNVYDASGRELKAARKGLNIIRQKDGRTVKVMR